MKAVVHPPLGNVIGFDASRFLETPQVDDTLVKAAVGHERIVERAGCLGVGCQAQSRRSFSAEATDAGQVAAPPRSKPGGPGWRVPTGKARMHPWRSSRVIILFTNNREMP